MPKNFFIVPILILVTNVIMLFGPFATTTIPFVVLKIDDVMCKLSSLVGVVHFHRGGRPKVPRVRSVAPVRRVGSWSS